MKKPMKKTMPKSAKGKDDEKSGKMTKGQMFMANMMKKKKGKGK